MSSSVILNPRVDPVGAPLEGTAGDPERERRVRDRYQFGRYPQVKFIIKPTFHAQRATIRDLSPKGVGLALGRLLEPQTVVAIQMRSMTANQAWIGMARVRHVTRLESGIWLLGCNFAQSLDDNDVASLIDDDLMDSGPDEVIPIHDHELLALLRGSPKPAPG
jgi:hypothetical protein